MVASRKEAFVTNKRKWRIRGFDGMNLMFECDVPIHHLSELQIEEVLRRLASRHLTEREILTASLNRNGKPTSLLDVGRTNQTPLTMTCGSDPHYVARVVED